MSSLDPRDFDVIYGDLPDGAYFAIAEERGITVDDFAAMAEGKMMGDDYFDDKELICADCNQPFTFTGGEQRFFAERQFSTPKRCKSCRDKKKEQRDGRGNRR